MRSAIARTPAGVAAAALVLVSTVALAGCEREAAPSAAPLPPPAADQPLAGAPEGPPPPAPAVAPDAPPPPADAPEGAPPPALEAPTAAESGIVAMAPIPNPPETPRRALPGAASHRVHHRYAQRRRPVRSHRTPAAMHAAAHAHARPASPATVRQAPAPATPPRKSGAGVAGSVSPSAGAIHHGEKAVAAHHHRAKSATAGANVGAGPRAERVAALQTALNGAMASSAKLDTPRFTAGAPADVSLTVPASFAETLRTEAGRQGLADDAASVALIARLAGDGYVVIPDTVQRQMLAAGQPSVFHWTVTQQQGARGPLQAGVGAQLLGGNGQDQLDLGIVKGEQASGTGWKVVGAILLLLVVAAIVAVLARAGSSSRAAERRRRFNGHRPAQRPFDMTSDRRNEPPQA